ncbi:MAG: helix-turn-helix domain-containing protein [Oscillospiraceae bacterium]|nr:helix-turn-helix domain-containing protein [Oscillospiraceae bacterium]
MNNTSFAVDCKPEITVSRAVPRMETIKNTAKLFGLPEHLVRQKVLSGEVVAISAGRRYLVNVDKFADYLNSNKLPAPNDWDEPAEHSGIYPIPVKL